MYEEHFGLKRKPFQLSPDAKFFYPSVEHKRALSFLQYGLSQADGFIVITGNVGTGKTTLVQTLLADLDDADLKIATIVSSNLRDHDLLEMVAHNIGVPVTDQSKAALLRDLESNFIEQAEANRRILLIVDEAQNLPPESVEELRMLSNFQIDGRPLVQIFLLGQQEFRTTLLSEGFEQLRQRIIATYHLNPLTEADTKTYIEHRLKVAGWEERPSFADDAYTAIYEFCEGVPRRINNVCDRLLLFAFLEDLDTIDSSAVETVAHEIGDEFLGGSVAEEMVSEPAPGKTAAAEVFDSPQAPLETMARSMFDKADVQNRLAALERAVDGLGHSIKPEIGEIKEELGFLRVMVDDLLYEVRSLSSKGSDGSSKKKRA